MSWEAVQWANRQRLRLPQEQLVLLMLANSADPEGIAFAWWKRKEHWWTYLVDHTRLSRATIFRHLNTIEDLGLGQRQKLVLGDGTVRFIMELCLDKFIDMEAEEADEAQDLDSQSHGETGETATSQSHGETESVSLVRLQEELPSESPDSQPDPSQPIKNEASGLSKEAQAEKARKRSSLEEFKSVFGGPPSSHPELVDDEWGKLTIEQEAQAMHGARGVAVLRAKQAKGLVGPLKFIRSSVLWADYGRHAPRDKAPPPPRIWQAVGSDEWRARAVLRAIMARAMPEPKPHPTTGEMGADFLGSLPHAGLVLAKFADEFGRVKISEWAVLDADQPHDKQRIAAWQERVTECIGVHIAPAMIFFDDYVEHLDGSGRPFKAKRRVNGLRVPQDWPPPKGEPKSPATGPPRQPSQQDLDEFTS